MAFGGLCITVDGLLHGECLINDGLLLRESNDDAPFLGTTWKSNGAEEVSVSTHYIGAIIPED
jgi:hypothetical protein